MPGGRPTLYDPEYHPKKAAKLCEFGATVDDLAEFFEVDQRTIYRWRAEHEEFCQSLKVGKAASDDRVESALYHRALGYDKDGKHYPPDPTSMIFWLKNRRREQWTDQKEDGDVGKVADAMKALADRLPN